MTRSGPSIVVDARMIASSGVGTYLRNTLSRIIQARPSWHFTLLGDREQLTDLGSPEALVDIKDAGAPVYSLREQLDFARFGLRRADLFWSPHYNIPLTRTSRLVVTVHDVMAHGQAMISTETAAAIAWPRCARPPIRTHTTRVANAIAMTVGTNTALTRSARF